MTENGPKQQGNCYKMSTYMSAGNPNWGTQRYFERKRRNIEHGIQKVQIGIIIHTIKKHVVIDDILNLRECFTPCQLKSDFKWSGQAGLNFMEKIDKGFGNLNADPRIKKSSMIGS